MHSRFEQNRRKSLAALVVAGVVTAWLITEVLLRVFFPYSVSTIGHISSENARKYGWGYRPHESMRLGDPDSGQVFVSRANNHGWRDRDRSYVNSTGAFRIVVLGDSVTFGAIVPDDVVMTYLLEDRLRNAGIHAEVINMAYGGWSTDQELEALLQEGLLYKPDLVIVQFCSNDLIYDPQEAPEIRNLKPFYYDLTDDSRLVRHDNPSFGKRVASPRNLAIGALKCSEVIKRLYGLYLHHRYGETPAATAGTRDAERTYRYHVNKGRLEQLKIVLNLDSGSRLLVSLAKRLDSNIGYDEITRAVNDARMGEHKAVVLRILENRWFHAGWSPLDYRPPPQDPTTAKWRLYFALMDKIRDVARLNGARVALFCETDRGHLEWSLAWHRVSPDAVSCSNYLGHCGILRSYAKSSGLDFIESTRVYVRARNDPHPNRQGYEAMAHDIYDHLMSKYADALAQHPLPSAAQSGAGR